MDERDRRAPIALAADAPIAQAVLRLALAPAFLFGAGDHRRLGLGHHHAIEEARVDADAVARLGLAGEGLVGVGGTGGHHADDGQRIFGGEIEVALVVPGHRHDRAGAVVHQHEVGDVHGQGRAGERVARGDAGVEAQLLGGFHFRRGGAAALAQRDEFCRHRVGRRHRLRHRVIGGDRHEAGAEDGVGPGGVDRQRIAGGEREAELKPLRLADPVLLHQLHFFGPVLQPVEPGEQFLGKLGDLQEPLRELALLHQCARSPAAPVDHLLVGEHGLVHRVPVDRRFLAIDEAGGVQVEEQRLLVAVVVRLAGGDLAAPVDREAQPFQLLLHAFDVVAGPAAGVDALFHRGIFRGHPEGVPAHRVEHLEALHPADAGDHVAHRVVAHVADVDAAGGIREHLQHIRAGLGAAIIGGETLRGVPRRLPARVGGGGVKSFGHGESIALPGRARHRARLQNLWR